MPTDICYQPITDKRYNRWKRTKRKGKGLKFSVASDDSDEEKVPESSSPRENRRRRKKTSAHTSPRFEASSNDASSEPLSDMAVESVHSQHYNSLRSSSTESRERYLYQEGAASNKPPSWSSEGLSLIRKIIHLLSRNVENTNNTCTWNSLRVTTNTITPFSMLISYNLLFMFLKILKILHCLLKITLFHLQVYFTSVYLKAHLLLVCKVPTGKQLNNEIKFFVDKIWQFINKFKQTIIFFFLTFI